MVRTFALVLAGLCLPPAMIAQPGAGHWWFGSQASFCLAKIDGQNKAHIRQFQGRSRPTREMTVKKKNDKGELADVKVAFQRQTIEEQITIVSLNGIQLFDTAGNLQDAKKLPELLKEERPVLVFQGKPQAKYLAGLRKDLPVLALPMVEHIASPPEGISMTMPVLTLWDRLGGEANIKKVVDDFLAAAVTDPKVDFTRGGKYQLDADSVAKLKKLLLEQISSIAGGPYKYTGRSMKEAHKGMAITNAQFDALAGHMEAALVKNSCKPEDAKLIVEVVKKMREDIVDLEKPVPKVKS